MRGSRKSAPRKGNQGNRETDQATNQATNPINGPIVDDDPEGTNPIGAGNHNGDGGNANGNNNGVQSDGNGGLTAQQMMDKDQLLHQQQMQNQRAAMDNIFRNAGVGGLASGAGVGAEMKSNELNGGAAGVKRDRDGKSVDLSGDFFSRRINGGGANAFNLCEFATGFIWKVHGDIAEDIISKICNSDNSAKRGDALSKAKFNPYICQMPRLLIDGILTQHARREISCNVPALKVLSDLAYGMKVVNEFTLRYGIDAQVHFAQLLGQKFGSLKPYSGEFERDLEQASNNAKFNRQMVAGFVKKSEFYKPKGNGFGQNARKKPRVDWAPYKDKNNPKWVPKGWCLYFFASGSCRKGQKCNHKHTKWTQAEFDAAKAAQ
eukprot:258403_1